MKVSALALTAASAGIALAQPHNHKHAHLHEQKRAVTTEVVTGATTTEIDLVINGIPTAIPMSAACAGIMNGKYEWQDGGVDGGICAEYSSPASSVAASTSVSLAASSTSTLAASSSYIAPSSSSVASAGAFFQQSSSSAAAAVSSSWAAASSASAPSAVASSSSSPTSTAASSASSASSSSGNVSSSGSGVSSTFPDGELDCTTFPSDYGAVSLSYLGLGGWAGVQKGSVVGNAIDNIVTAVSGGSCTEGSYCSYACPPGYQKSQWPSSQGATGQSVGGIMCSGGKLKLTNSGLSSQLCIPGQGSVQATNNAGQVVSICRTDYPGTESETIPVELQSGSTEALANPNAASYYMWEGKATSAQYYLNPPGYGAEDACVWGSPSQPLGNYAPINFGVGYKDGTTWLSIFQNSPTTSATYPGTVELQGDLSGSCTYSNGQYCSASGCNSNGCTVSILSGTATYVISD